MMQRRDFDNPSQARGHSMDGTPWKLQSSKLEGRDMRRPGATDDLPPGFPRELDSKLVWSGNELVGRESEIILQLSQADLDELQQAVASFRARNLELYQICPDVFPLPNLSRRFAYYKESLHAGLGFFTIRGLNPASYDDEGNIVLHAGLVSYFGNKRALQQNYHERRAEVLLHVTDVSREKRDGTDIFLAPGNQNIAIGFHSDNGDNVSLYCRQTASSGGELYFSSTWTIYNQLARDHKDVLRTLAAPWQWQVNRTGQGPAKSKDQPLFYFEGGKLLVNYQKRPLRGTKEEPRDSGLQPLSKAQEEALGVVDRLAFENALAIQQKPGDLHFFNNLCILHARSAFTDRAAQPAARRHLTRMIFRDDNLGWKIPSTLSPEWNMYFDHDPAVERFPLEPKAWNFSLSGHD